MEKFKVTFYPDNKSIEVAKDTSILSAAISAGVYINSNCGGDGVCGRCKVKVASGQVITQPTGSISLQEISDKVYLACMTTVHSDLEVEVLAQSRMDLEKPVLQGLYSESEDVELLAQSAGKESFGHSPLAEKLYLELPRPSPADTLSDLERLYRELKRKGKTVLQAGLPNVRQLGELLRDSGWKVSVTLGRREDAAEILLVEPGNTSARNFGFCFDIGTTTISGQLVDLNKKKILGTRVTYNKQAAFGSDVITRIVYAAKEDGLERLHQAVTEGMNQIIHELSLEHDLDLNDATCVLCAGNTTMTHLLLRIDPTFIRKEPYIPTVNFPPDSRASEVGIKINPRGLLSCMPGVASYVGGDVTSGVLSCGLYAEKDLCMLIDIGTNGEIVLGNKEFMIATAASAGPAFEGSGVSCGMRSSRGAIEKVTVNHKDLEVKYSTVAGQRPRGICGSGYIDIICEMLKAGIIDKSGRIKPDTHRRIRRADTGKEFVLVFKEDADSRLSDIVISEPDIENLKRAKAAIFSAASTLVRHMGFDFTQVRKVFIAGGFGNYIDINKAVEIGLLPDLGRSRFKFIGNSSLAGSRSALLSADAMKRACDIAAKVTYLDLSNEPSYMDEYMAALFFPHTDLNKFPSIKVV